MINKICTSIEQSNKLLSLGLDPSTADMYWWYSGKRYYVESMDDDDFNKESDIPAWSLTALLKLMPVPYQLTSNNEGKCQLMLINNLRHDWYDAPLDAAFEMVCWLIEQGHIKVNK